MRRYVSKLLSVIGTLALLCCTAISHAADWQAGVGRVVITPEEPTWMSGYGSRDHAFEGKVHDLYARASALRDPQGSTAVFVSLDLVGVPIKMVQVVSADLEKRHKIPRRSLMIACSHTHCGPALDNTLSYMLNMQEADWQPVKRYQAYLNQKVIDVIDKALADLQPARLSVGQGQCGFASNRRAPIGVGPFDHQVPVLKIESADGSKLRGLVFGYACHNTTLSFYQLCGDYAGFAQLYLEERHPDSVAMFFTGCGADQNPLPRRSVELCEKYGRMLGTAVDQVLNSSMTPLSGQLSTRFKDLSLDFASTPTEEQLQADLTSKNHMYRNRAKLLLADMKTDAGIARSYPYPVQVWKLGDQITWVALGGEVVIDYQIRLRNELGRDRTWVTGYANDVMGYIPSERVLIEGGYEGDTSLYVYQMPSKWKAGLEDRIVNTVHELAK